MVVYRCYLQLFAGFRHSGGHRSLVLDQKTCVNGGVFPLLGPNLGFKDLSNPGPRAR